MYYPQYGAGYGQQQGSQYQGGAPAAPGVPGYAQGAPAQPYGQAAGAYGGAQYAHGGQPYSGGYGAPTSTAYSHTTAGAGPSAGAGPPGVTPATGAGGDAKAQADAAEAYRIAAWQQYYAQQAAQQQAAQQASNAAAQAQAQAHAQAQARAQAQAQAQQRLREQQVAAAHQRAAAAAQRIRMQSATAAYGAPGQGAYGAQAQGQGAYGAARPAYGQQQQPPAAAAPYGQVPHSYGTSTTPAQQQSSLAAAAARIPSSRRGRALLPKPPAPRARPTATTVQAQHANGAGAGGGAAASGGSAATAAAGGASSYPPGLQRWVTRAFQAAQGPGGIVQVQTTVHNRIATLTREGRLWSIDWDAEPLPGTSSHGKSRRSRSRSSSRGRSRRRRSRWGSRSRSRSRSRSYSSGSSRSYSSGSRSRSRSRSRSPRTRWGAYVPLTDQTGAGTPGRGRGRGRGGAAAGGRQARKRKRGEVGSAANAMALGAGGENRRGGKQRRGRKGRASKAQKDLGSSIIANTAAIVGADGKLDLDAMIVRGTCQELEKPYLRLTGPPAPEAVRPQEVLERAVERLKQMWGPEADYIYVRDQLKAIRQDLLVQHIRNDFTVRVYELHARIALERGDLNEFNQCQTQLLPLRQLGLGSTAVRREFTAYKLLYQIHKQQLQEFGTELRDMPAEELGEAPVQHALAVRNALVTGNYAAFFRLHGDAPNMGSYLLDGMLLRQRVLALTKMTKAYFPTFPVSLAVKQLAFTSTEEAVDFLAKAGCVTKMVKPKAKAGAGSGAGAASPKPVLVVDSKASKVAMFKETVTQADIGDGRAG